MVENMGRNLTTEEKNRLYYAIMDGRNSEVVLYQTPDFRMDKKIENTRKNSVGKMNVCGDVAHFLAYGLTFGGVMHMACRSNSQQTNWNTVVKNATERAQINGLFWTQNQPCTQLVVAGRKYMTLYEQGEFNSRIINYYDVVQVKMSVGGMTILSRNPKNPDTYLSSVISSSVAVLDQLAMFVVEGCFRNYGYAA